MRRATHAAQLQMNAHRTVVYSASACKTTRRGLEAAVDLGGLTCQAPTRPLKAARSGRRGDACSPTGRTLSPLTRTGKKHPSSQNPPKWLSGKLKESSMHPIASIRRNTDGRLACNSCGSVATGTNATREGELWYGKCRRSNEAITENVALPSKSLSSNQDKQDKKRKKNQQQKR